MIAKLMLPISIIMLISSAGASCSEDLPDLVDRTLPSTVVIYAYNDSGDIEGDHAIPDSQGSGFFINRSGAIITCLHVLKGFNRSEVKTSDGNRYPVEEVISKDIEGDLICIKAKVPRNNAYPISINSAFPRVGEAILAISSPLDLEQSVSEGVVSAIRDIPGYGKRIQIDAPISRGSSGGSVINCRGEVIGVAASSAEGGQLINFAIPSERVIRLSQGKAQTIEEWNARGFDSAEEAFFKGVNYVRDYEYKKALPYFVEAIKIDPNYKEAYLYAGYCNNELGYYEPDKYEDAIEYFDEAIERDPKNDDAWNNKGYAILNLGRFNESIVYFDIAIGFDPLNAQAWCNKGFALYNLSRYSESIKYFDRSLEINPFNARAWDNKGLAFARLGMINESLGYFGQSVRIDEFFAPAWNNIGFALFILGKYNESLYYYDRALWLQEREQIRPSHALAWNNKGQAFFELNRYKEALNCFDRATELQPDNPKYWENTGVTLFKLDRYDEALECLEKAIRLDPTYMDAWRYKALSLKQLNRDAEAKEAFANAEALSKNERDI